MRKALICFILLLTLGSFTEISAEGFDLGVGLGFADSPDQGVFDGGWDIQLGYEFNQTENWNFGTELHIINGWTTKGDVEEEKEYAYEESTMMAFNSQALYLTARPEHRWVNWLQFKAGVVRADYHTVKTDEITMGTAMGVGIVFGSEKFRLRMLDYHRYFVGGDSFNVYSFSLFIFLAPAAGSISFN